MRARKKNVILNSMHKTKWLYCPECKTKMEGTYPSCPQGHFTKYPTPVASTIGLVEYEGKYLAMKRNDEPAKGLWDLPGGFVNKGETALEALLREIHEETQLLVESGKFIGTFPSIYGNTDISVLGCAYVVHAKTNVVVLSDENTEHAWFTLDELPELAFSDCQQAIYALRGDF